MNKMNFYLSILMLIFFQSAWAQGKIGKKIKQTKNQRLQISALLFLLHLPFLQATTVNPTEAWKTNIPMCHSAARENTLATIQPITDGLWYDPNIWSNGQLPTINDDVIIPVGRTVTMAGTCRARKIEILGTLRAVNWQTGGAWIEMRTKAIHVANGGRFEIGTANQPYLADCDITLIGDNPSEELCAAMGTKFIGAMSGGTIEIHGKPQVSWTNLSQTAEAGATTIVLKEAVNWEVDDKIVLTSTGLNWNHVDEVVIQSISADKKTMTLKSPLQYRHVGGEKSYTRAQDGKTWTANIYGEVALLSHNVTIQGDESSVQSGFGGHIMAMKGSVANIENAELYRMGQKSKIGRYPFHWHLCEDQARGQYFKNNSVHKSFNRAITIHGTDYTTVEGNVAYDHIGHGVFLEDGGERFNTIKRNLVFITRRPAPGEQLTPSDNEADGPQNRTPSSYWITNANNYFDGNVAAGTEGTGFWIIQPETPMAASGSLPYYSGMQPHTEPLGSFTNFVAHSCMNGFDIFDRLNPNHSLKGNFGWIVQNEQFIQNGLFYANDQALYCGLDFYGNPNYVVFKNCIFTDNKLITMLAADLVLDDCLFNVNTELGVFEGERSFFWFYDGPGKHTKCHFVGWNRADARLVKNTLGVGAGVFVSPTFENTTKAESQPYVFKFVKAGLNEYSRKYSTFFRDLDGGLTGKANTTITPTHPFLIDGHEYIGANWENAARSDYTFGMIFNESLPIYAKQVTAVRTKDGTAPVCAIEEEDVIQQTQFPLILDQGFLYTLHYKSLPNNNLIRTGIMRADLGSSFLVRYKGFGKLNGLSLSSVYSLTRVYSLDNVKNASGNAYYIDNDGDLYLKRVSAVNDKNTVQVVTISWISIGTYQTTLSDCDSDADGDGTSNFVESFNGRDPNNPADLSFDFNGSDENFKQNQITASNLGSGENWLLLASFSNDPYIFRENFAFDGNKLNKIKVRTKSEASGVYQLYWHTQNSPGFSTNKSVTVNYPNSNQWVELEFDMSNNPLWINNKIIGLRLDFPPNSNGHTHTWIDWIKGPGSCGPLTISGSTTVCSGQTTTLTASGGTSYLWSNGSTTASITVGVGTYTVTATNASGCTGVKTVTISETNSNLAFTNCPNNISLTTSNGCALANWTAPLATSACGTPVITSNYNPGFCFPVGTTNIVYTATLGNTTKTCSFTVTVNQPVVGNMGSIGDFVFSDNNNNRVYDTGDTPISGVNVTLSNANNVIIARTAATTTGNYSFGNLAAGTYIVRFPATLADGKTITTTNPIIVNLTTGQKFVNADAGYKSATTLQTGSIGDLTFNDNNNNGVYNTGDTPLSTVTITLSNSSGQTITTATTNAGGLYSFGNLVAGTYIVKFPATIGRKNITTQRQITVNLAAGQNNSAADAGYYQQSGGSDLCANPSANIVGGNGSIVITGITTGSAIIQVFNNKWIRVYNQPVNGSTATVPSLPAGFYIVKVTVLSAGGSWPAVCEKIQTLNVTGSGGGTPPVANNDAVVTAFNTPVTIHPLTNDQMPNACSPQSLTVTQPSPNGTVQVSGFNFIFTPTTGFSGTTTFKYTINSTCGTSNAATVTVTVESGGSSGATGCEALVVVGNANGTITVSGLGANKSTIQIFNSQWQRVFNQQFNQPTTTASVKNGTYVVKVQLYNTNGTWQFLCEKMFQNITVTGGVASLASGRLALDLTAAAELHKVKLVWANNTGYKNDYFEVEKLNEKSSIFEKIAIINSQNSDKTEYYTAFDEQPTEGDNIYRVNLVGADGTTKVSNQSVVKFNKTNDFRIFPNPASDYIDVDLKQYEGKAATLYLYDNFGKLMMTQQVEQATSLPVHLDLQGKASGSYLLRVTSSGRKDAVKKFIIQQ